MTSYAIEDYRCAVAMWGAMCGYADMPKTFFNRIIEGISVEEAYQYVCCIEARIHGYESATLVTQFSQMTEETDIPLVEPIEYNSLENIVLKYLTEYEKEKGKKMPKSHRDSIKKALSFTSDGTVLSFLMKLNDFPGFTKKTQTSFWTYLKDKTCPEYDEVTTGKTKKKSAKNKQEIPSLFGSIMDEYKNDTIVGMSNSSKEAVNLKQTIIETPLCSENFIDDSNALSFINALPYIKPYLDSITRDIIYIQKEYKVGGQYAKGGKKESNPSNNQVIKHLGNLIKKVHKEHPIPEEIINRLTKDLFDRYNVR